MGEQEGLTFVVSRSTRLNQRDTRLLAAARYGGYYGGASLLDDTE